MLYRVIKVRLDKNLKRRKKTLYWLAKEADLPYLTVWRISQGKAKGITFDVLERICGALECKPGDLLEIEK
jgi:putative transcriptional regulator